MKIIKALMGLLFLGTMASSQAVILDTCSWDHPGVNPYRGTVDAAIDHYRDLSPELRAKFKERANKKQFDEVVTITKDGITGVHVYEPTITDMHFGGGTSKPQLCRATTREKWEPTRKEMGLVYCEGETCIMIPTVCNNVSRIKRLPESASSTASQSSGGTQAAGAEQAAQPAEGGGGGGGGSLAELPASVATTGAGESEPTWGHNNNSGFNNFQPWSPWNGGGGGGYCCYTGPVIPPIVTPPIVVPPPVPEPAEWMMMLFGVVFVLFFSAIRKRRK